MDNLSGSMVPLKDVSDLTGYVAGAAVAIGGNTAFFSTDVTMPKLCVRQTIQICTDTASIFNVICTSKTNQALKLNNAQQLTANALNNFTIACRPDETYNYKLTTGGNITDFKLEGVYGGF
jgi:hypothetical protein